MKKDRAILYKSVVNHSFFEKRVDFIYIEDSDIYYSHILLDSTKSEIWDKSNSEGEEKIILMGIERNKTIQTEVITEHKELNDFISKSNIIDKIRDYKLNQIIKK